MMRGMAVRAVPPLCGFALTVGIAGMAWSFAPDLATAQSTDTEAARRIAMQRMVQGIREDYPDVATISAPELRDRVGAEAFILVDVRTAQEREVSMLPGAITRADFESRLPKLVASPGSHGPTVVVYCTIGRRSADYAQQMKGLGVEVLNLEGSVLAWTHAGGQLVNAGVPTNTLHVYGSRWDLAADGYETVW